MRSARTRHRGWGAILPFTLLCLVMLAMLGAGALRDTALEWRMSVDRAQREEMRYWARAAAEALIAEPAHFPLSLPAGRSLCGGTTPRNCSGSLPDVGGRIGLPGRQWHVDYRVRRGSPAQHPALHLRVAGGTGPDGALFEAAVYELQLELRAAVGPGEPQRLDLGLARLLSPPPGWAPMVLRYWRESGADDL